MKNAVVLKENNHFNIKQILESGQIFRFEEIGKMGYSLIAKQKVIKLIQQQESTSMMIHGTSMGEFEEIWRQYLDLDTDYKKIAETLAAKDPHMKAAIQFGEGIRILKQDPWEMLISFIISQNKAIPQIKQCINNIACKFGERIEEAEDAIYYTFPTAKALAAATEEEIRECKVGFRAPYILDAARKVEDGSIDLNDLYTSSTEEAREVLMRIKGVGPKIADCILLFAYSKMEVFPTDVWIKRVVEGLYFKGEDIKLKELQTFAKEYFGDLAGYAQQYLFFYARENGLFK